MSSHLLVEDGQLREFTPIDSPLYLSYSEFNRIPAKFWKVFFKKNTQIILAISYDFGLQYLFQEELNADPGLFIQPVIEVPITNKPILLPKIKEVNPFLNENDFLKIVQKIHRKFCDGDFYLINYTFPIEITADKFESKEIYLGRAGVSIELPDLNIISFSPETFLKIEGSDVRTFPIKGTSSSNTNKKDLLKDKKENSEQFMVVDLMRNELGKICLYGSVSVEKFKRIKSQHGLYQMYSVIKGTLKNFSMPHSILEIMPPGSVTGMPKYEVCSFLKEQEPRNRSFYTGIAGYYNFSQKKGFFDLLIRSIEIKKDIILMAGSGLTIESDPIKEYREIMQKAQSVINLCSSSDDLLINSLHNRDRIT